MTRLFLIRHAEPAAAWGGSAADPGLSALGREQARAAAERLSDLGRLDVVTSPMRRCWETAAPFAEAAGRPPVLEPCVSEVAAPPEVADRRAWLQQTFPWRGGAPRLWTSLAPELHAWRQAMLGYVRGLSADAAIFTHFIAINVIVGAALDRAETIVCRPAHASITELELENEALRLVKVGAEMANAEVL